MVVVVDGMRWRFERMIGGVSIVTFVCWCLGDFSVLQVSFNMQRLSGYFLIQVSSKRKTKLRL